MSNTTVLRARRCLAATTARLCRDRSGAVMLEFAFVIIPFMGLIFASLYTSLVYFSSQALETTVQKAARVLVIGEAQLANRTQADYKAQVCGMLPSYMKCSRLYVDVRTSGSASFATLNMAAATPTIAANGDVTNSGTYQRIGEGHVGLVRIAYIWDAGRGPGGVDLSNTGTGDGRRVLVGTSVFIAEPFES